MDENLRSCLYRPDRDSDCHIFLSTVICRTLRLATINPYLHLDGAFGVLILGFALGWYLRGVAETTDSERVDAIEGCIEKDNIVWNGTADLSRGAVVNIEVDYKQICPVCQTPMRKESYELSSGGRRRTPSYGHSTTRRVWECPNNDCGHTATRESGQYDEAENLFERHVGRIVESQNEEYSLQNLLDRIGDGKEVTPRRIWEEYVEVVDNEHVSTSCFH